MTRLNQIADRVQEWKKSSARCRADIALSLVRVHCKEAKEDKMASLKVANTKKHSFQDFMDTFLEAALASPTASISTASATRPVLLPPSD